MLLRRFHIARSEFQPGEDARMENIISRFSPDGNGGRLCPAEPREIVGFFGATRLYNESYWKRTPGWTRPCRKARPITAAANGRVILAETLPIRGKVSFDHNGWAFYSGYAHLTHVWSCRGSGSNRRRAG
jgi:hypothetical protein